MDLDDVDFFLEDKRNFVLIDLEVDWIYVELVLFN